MSGESPPAGDQPDEGGSGAGEPPRHTDGELVLPSLPDHVGRVAYLGTPDAAVEPLRALVGAGVDVGVVVTRADKRRGRRRPPEPSPVKAAAIDLGLTVSHDPDDLLDVEVDLGIVVAFGRLIRPHLLTRIPFVNLHFSLLPRWRGAAPVERAILAGDTVTGVCLMRLEEGLDTGPVLARREVAIDPRETARQLRDRLVVVGADLLVEGLHVGRLDPEPQRGEVTYAEKIGPDDLRLDWTSPAEELVRRVRVGGAFTTFRGRRLKVHGAAVEGDGDRSIPPGELHSTVVGTGTGGLRLLEVQVEGKGRVDARSWCNGARPEPGERLGA